MKILIQSVRDIIKHLRKLPSCLFRWENAIKKGGEQKQKHLIIVKKYLFPLALLMNNYQEEMVIINLEI